MTHPSLPANCDLGSPLFMLPVCLLGRQYQDHKSEVGFLLVRAVFIAAAISAATLGVAHINDTTSIVLASCDSGYYENSDGQCIHDPSSGGGPSGGWGIVGGGPPAGATAVCHDGDYSHSTHHSGTCSGHGGVSQWLTS